MVAFMTDAACRALPPGGEVQDLKEQRERRAEATGGKAKLKAMLQRLNAA